MPLSDPDPHHGSDAPADHKLTDMERFFDNLFNHHMVLREPPADLHPGQDVEDRGAPHDNAGVTPV